MMMRMVDGATPLPTGRRNNEIERQGDAIVVSENIRHIKHRNRERGLSGKKKLII